MVMLSQKTPTVCVSERADAALLPLPLAEARPNTVQLGSAVSAPHPALSAQGLFGRCWTCPWPPRGGARSCWLSSKSKRLLFEVAYRTDTDLRLEGSCLPSVCLLHEHGD